MHRHTHTPRGEETSKFTRVSGMDGWMNGRTDEGWSLARAQEEALFLPLSVCFGDLERRTRVYLSLHPLFSLSLVSQNVEARMYIVPSQFGVGWPGIDTPAPL